MTHMALVSRVNFPSITFFAEQSGHGWKSGMGADFAVHTSEETD